MMETRGDTREDAANAQPTSLGARSTAFSTNLNRRPLESPNIQYRHVCRLLLLLLGAPLSILLFVR